MTGFCLPAGYNKCQVPSNPTGVRIKMRVNDVTEVSDTDFTVTLNAFLIATWAEPRIYRSRKPAGATGNATTKEWTPVDSQIVRYKSRQ